MDTSQLSDTDWARIGAAFENLSGDHAGREIEEALSFTRQPVENFEYARLNTWHVPGHRREDQHAVYYLRSEAIKGRRCDVAVIDCGDFRAIIQI